jgi:hypothetical protein
VVIYIAVMNLCSYKDILGKPGLGVHSYRIINLAIADIIMTLIASAIISYILKYPFIWVTVFMFALGILIHRVFCVRTTIDKFLFG